MESEKRLAHHGSQFMNRTTLTTALFMYEVDVLTSIHKST